MRDEGKLSFDFSKFQKTIWATSASRGDFLIIKFDNGQIHCFEKGDEVFIQSNF